MLQKIYWLGKNQNEYITRTQEFRTLFCKYEFPYATFLSPAFMMVGGGQVSNTYAWTLAINNCSIFIDEGFVETSTDYVSKQIRHLLILRMNLFFGESPEEVERYCNGFRSIGGNLVPSKILPNFFGDDSSSLYKKLEVLAPWLEKVLSLPRKKYCSVCNALAAYERSIQVLSSDATLSYSLLVFIVESLANSHSDYQATWDDLRGESRKRFDALLEDESISSIDSHWINKLRMTLVDTIHPGATRRFVKFALDHLSVDLFDASNSTTSFPLRCSRIEQCIQNAYVLRSTFSHGLTPLTQLLISESYCAEEIEQGGEAYLTLRGLFRLTRSIILEFIRQQETEELLSYPWREESASVIKGARHPAYARMKSPNGQTHNIEAQYAQSWFEDILQIYQDNYVEELHTQVDSDVIFGAAASGPWSGRFLFRFDPNPSYDWESVKEQSLRLIPQAKNANKEYLQSIALLCIHLIALDGEEAERDAVLTARTFGNPIWELGRFVVDVIHNKTQNWTSIQAGSIFEKHLKGKKLFLPTRVEVACMLEIARLFEKEGSEEGQQKWLKVAYGDTARYKNLQALIQRTLESGDSKVSPQDVLNIPRKVPNSSDDQEE